MDIFKQNVRNIAASTLVGASAVCSGVIATGVTTGSSLEGLRSLGFFLSSFVLHKTESAALIS